MLMGKLCGADAPEVIRVPSILVIKALSDQNSEQGRAGRKKPLRRGADG
jgi:hypothetical protein